MEKVFVVTTNILLKEWCKKEISPDVEILFTSLNFLLEQNENPSAVAVVLDADGLTEINCLRIMEKSESGNPIFILPLILLYGKRNSVKSKSYMFPVSASVSVYDKTDTLNDFLHRIKNKEKKPVKKKNVNTGKTVCKKTDYKKSIAPELFSSEPVSENFCYGKSECMKKFLRLVNKAAESSENVLLLGESGSGKSFTAEFIHKKSFHSRKKFYSISLPEIAPALIESHLFGVCKGAYTNAVETKGIFEEAEGSTLFLDEIGELVPSLQSKLLSVIESKSYRKVGMMKERKLKSRLIFATNADMKKVVGAGNFRQDLFYRIAVLTIEVPPLRKHLEDVPYLANYFVHRKHHSISESAVEKLKTYSWPGNIRELNNVLNRACTYSSHKEIRPDDIIFD